MGKEEEVARPYKIWHIRCDESLQSKDLFTCMKPQNRLAEEYGFNNRGEPVIDYYDGIFLNVRVIRQKITRREILTKKFYFDWKPDWLIRKEILGRKFRI